jgi:hypothetical protein
MVELERAVSNHEAQAGVMVVAQLGQAPGSVLLQLFDNLESCKATPPSKLA